MKTAACAGGGKNQVTGTSEVPVT